MSEPLCDPEITAAQAGHCVLCREGESQAFAELRGVPLNCSATIHSREAALAVSLGDIQLGYCVDCGMIRNLIFDPERLTYDEDYENSLHHSPSFHRFAEELARELIETHGVRDKSVVDIGSGKGEFLRLLCALGNNRGLGFDPSYSGPEEPNVGRGVRFVPDLYDERSSGESVDLICCRHVLEHIDEPRTLLASLRRTLGEQRNAVLYFEVPDAEFVLKGDGMWDIIYPHCSYFTAPAMRRIFEVEGFRVHRIRRVFGDQFLSLEATLGDPDEAAELDPSEELETLAGHVEAFSARFRERVEHWSDRLEQAQREGHSVALWGAGAKGVTFLNVVDRDGKVGSVVDLNPRKLGTFVPGTGQQIEAPDILVQRQPKLVLIMNPMYRKEIASRLEEMGVAADIELV